MSMIPILSSRASTQSCEMLGRKCQRSSPPHRESLCKPGRQPRLSGDRSSRTATLMLILRSLHQVTDSAPLVSALVMSRLPPVRPAAGPRHSRRHLAAFDPLVFGTVLGIATVRCRVRRCRARQQLRLLLRAQSPTSVQCRVHQCHARPRLRLLMRA